jgi:hypothetical protein
MHQSDHQASQSAGLSFVSDPKDQTAQSLPEDPARL